MVRSAIRRKHELSSGSFVIRVFGAGLLLLVALAGVVAQLWIAYHRS